MIPVRVPMDAAIHTVGGVRTLDADHPAYSDPCPVCDGPAGDAPITLVLVGFAPGDRRPTGWGTGGAVVVHAACAGVEA